MKRLPIIFFTLVLGFLILAGVFIFLGGWNGGTRVAQAITPTRYVSSVSGNDTGACTNKSTPCRSIQYAVNQANGGDDIYIATYEIAGTVGFTTTTTARYTGSNVNVVELTKSLTLKGGYVYWHVTGFPVAWTPGVNPAEVDGEGDRRAIYIRGVTTTLELLSFVNGSAVQGGNIYAEDADISFIATPVMSGTATYGGGLYLKNCHTSFEIGNLSGAYVLGFANLLPVQHNSASYGGGVYVDGGTPLLSGLYINANTAIYDGGGFYLYSGQSFIVGGLVLENQAGDRGGGFFLGNSPARIAGIHVYSNIAAEGAGFYLDGPFAFTESRIPILANNVVRHNGSVTTSQGGGFHFHQTIAGLVNNIIADNNATDGGAMYLWASSPQLFHNTIAQNAGNNGIYATNKPGQLWPLIIPIPSQPSLTNTIIVSHTMGVYVNSTGLPAPFQNKVSLYGTLWNGNGSDTGGSGTIVRRDDVSGDPRFTCIGDPPGCLKPYHILTDSLAMDSGIPVALSLSGEDLLVDIDLDLRPAGEGYDIGADEVRSETYSVWLVPPMSMLGAQPGMTITHTHWLMNSGVQTDTYSLDYASDTGWATLLAASPVQLAPQTSTTVQLRVVVPLLATHGMSDTTVISATSSNAQTTALDVTEAVTGSVSDLAVEKWADVERASPGDVLHFSIAITRSGSLTGTLWVSDTVVPSEALAMWGLPSNCAGEMTAGEINCEWSLPEGHPLFTQTFNIAITTTETFTGVLINTAEIGADEFVIDSDPANNTSQATVAISGRKVYLPIVVRNQVP